MYYKKLYIRDFGIFSNQNLNNISKNLVVIGGKNRAGKSTFLKLLRYLPYGLPRKDSIPPADNKYYIEAELEKENKSYNLFLNGYSSPEVIDQKQNHHSAAELFNRLDQLSYQQLFSISLDELQHLSKIAKGEKQKKRLFSILLGAGFSELVRVPELADKYFNNAKNIGGTLGDPAVASFKPYYNQIKTAEENRDQALLEIKEFTKKREELAQSQENLNLKKQKIERLENKYLLLDLLKNNYSELEELEKMELELAKMALDSSDLNSDNLNQNGLFLKKINNLLSFIKSQSKKIKSFQKKEEVLKEKVKNYQLHKDKIANNYQLLKAEVKSLNSSWENPLQQLENINTDLLKEQDLNKKLRKFEKLNSEIEGLQREINDLNAEIEANSSELEALDYENPAAVLKKSYLILAFSLISLSSSVFVDFNQLRYLSVIIALAAFIYYSSNYKSSSLKKQNADKIKAENKAKNNKLVELKQQQKQRLEELNKIEAEIDNYAQILGIAESDYLTFLDSYFREIRDKKRRYQNLQVEEKENKEKRKELEKSLLQLRSLITNIDGYCNLNLDSGENRNLIENFSSLFKDFNLVTDLFTLSENYLSQKSQLEHTLKSSHKIKKALSQKNGKNNYYQSFVKLYREFSSLNAVEGKKKSLSEKLSELKREKSDLEEKITTLKNRIAELSTSTKIEKAQQEIDRAQTALEKKAEHYAVNKSVYFILKKLRSKMIEKAEKELLKPAAEILNRISGDHYKALETAADIEQTDFEIIAKNGSKYNSVEQLSRGSLEQLFLAVRISRIKEIEPPLPIVLDDSFVNFDRSHLYNTAKLISELADRHQIFILSCHPHLISYISQLSDSAQYWKLESGRFELSNQDKLIDYLQH